jgi:membrane associated rhomboid family serine protease
MSRFPTFSRMPVTLSLVLSLVIVHLALWIAGEEAGAASRPSRVSSFSDGAWWKYVASAWVHVGWEHLAQNAGWILFLGFWLEPRMGRLRTAALVLISDVLSSLTGLGLDLGFGFGASGIGFAFAGALASRPIWNDRQGLLHYRPVWIIFVYLLVTRYDGLATTLVGHAAHVGGLITGLLFGLIRWSEDSVRGQRAIRLRHAAAISLVIGVVACVEAMEPRYAIRRMQRDALSAEDAGDFTTAERQWRALICLADPLREFDGLYINNAARYSLRRGDRRRAIDLLSTIAFTASTPAIHRDIGHLRAQLDPPDMHGALDAWRKSYHTSRHQPDVLHGMAQARVFTDDTLLFDPVIAADLARRAVHADRMQHPWYMRTLAHALFELDRFDQAFRWMDRAHARADSAARVVFESDLDWMRTWLRENEPDTLARMVRSGVPLVLAPRDSLSAASRSDRSAA